MLPLFVLSVLVSGSAFGVMAPKTMTVFNKTCPTPAACAEVVKLRDACEGKKKDCEKFVSEFKKLLPEYDCQRPFDKTSTDNYIVPAIWLCDHDNSRMESLLHSLNKLQIPAAQKLFRSAELRKTLDGDTAETFVPLWEKAQPKPKKRASK